MINAGENLEVDPDFGYFFLWKGGVSFKEKTLTLFQIEITFSSAKELVARCERSVVQCSTSG